MHHWCLRIKLHAFTILQVALLMSGAHCRPNGRRTNPLVTILVWSRQTFDTFFLDNTFGQIAPRGLITGCTEDEEYQRHHLVSRTPIELPEPAWFLSRGTYSNV